MRSPSPSRIEPGRAGFTLLEVLLAAAIGTIVIGMTINAYSGANRTLNATVGANQIKIAGEKGIDKIYRTLKSAKKIFDRGTTADSWLARTDLEPYKTGGLSPAVPTADLLLPLIMDTADFTGTQTPAPSPPVSNCAGNALLFVATEPAAVVADATPTPGPLTTVYGSDKFRFSAYRFHFFFLVRRPIGLSDDPIRPPDRYTYNLMHWESEPYLDYREVKEWMSRLVTYSPALSPSPTAYIDAKLDALSAGGTVNGPYQGAVDLAAADASMAATTPALYDLTASTAAPTHQDLVANTTSLLASHDYRTALDYGVKGSFALGMVAFNNGSATSPAPVRLIDMSKGESLAVPLYAAASETRPFGFEVVVGGPTSGRQVLLRLALASRSNSGGRGIAGLSISQIVQVFEY